MTDKLSTMYKISIAGTSGSGKTFIINSLKQYLNESAFSHFDLDGYHIHNRVERTLRNSFPEQISENDFDKIVKDINKLTNRQQILIPIYNHTLGKVVKHESLNPKKILIIEGLHAILLNDFLKENKIDLNIFLNTEKNIQRAWKVKRDIEKRGYSYEKVITEIENRSVYENQYVNCQIKSADVIVNTRICSNEYVREVLLSINFMSKIKNTSFEKYFSFEKYESLENEFFIIKTKRVIKDKKELTTSLFIQPAKDFNDSFQASIITLINLIVFLINTSNHES